MSLLLRSPVPKMGRPKKGEPKAETTQVRVSPEMAELLSDLALVHPKTTAQILDQLALIDVRELHGRYKKLIDDAKATSENAEAKLKQLRDAAARIEKGEVDPTGAPKHSQPHRPKPGS